MSTLRMKVIEDLVEATAIELASCSERHIVDNLCDVLPHLSTDESVNVYINRQRSMEGASKLVGNFIKAVGPRHLLCTNFDDRSKLLDGKNPNAATTFTKANELMLLKDMGSKCEHMFGNKVSQSIVFTGSYEAGMNTYAKKYLDLLIGKKLASPSLVSTNDVAFLIYDLFGNTSCNNIKSDSHHFKVVDVHVSPTDETILGINYNFCALDHNRLLTSAYDRKSYIFDLYSFVLAALSKEDISKYKITTSQLSMKNENCFLVSKQVNLYDELLTKLRKLGFTEVAENEMKSSVLALLHLQAFIFQSAENETGNKDQSPSVSTDSFSHRIKETFRLTEAMENHIKMAEALLGFESAELINLFQLQLNSTGESTSYYHADIALAVCSIFNEIHSRLFHSLLSFCTQVSFQTCTGKQPTKRNKNTLSFTVVCLGGWKDNKMKSADLAVPAAIDSTGGSSGGNAKPNRRRSVADTAASFNDKNKASVDFSCLQQNYITEVFHQLIFESIGIIDKTSDKVEGSVRNEAITAHLDSDFSNIIGNFEALFPMQVVPVSLPLSEIQRSGINLDETKARNQDYELSFDDDNKPVIVNVQHSFGDVSYDLCRFRKDNVYSYSDNKYPSIYPKLIESRSKNVDASNIIFLIEEASIDNIFKVINKIDSYFIKDYVHNDFEMPPDHVGDMKCGKDMKGRAFTALERTRNTCNNVKMLLLSSMYSFCFCVTTIDDSTPPESVTKQILAIGITPLIKACYMSSCATENIRTLFQRFEQAILLTKNVMQVKEVYADLTAIYEQQKKTKASSQLADSLTARWFTNDRARVEKALWTIFQEILQDTLMQPILVEMLEEDIVIELDKTLKSSQVSNLFWFDNAYSCVHVNRSVYNMFCAWNSFKVAQIEYSSTKVQAEMRATAQRRKFLMLKLAINRVKALFRMRKARAKFLKERGAGHKIKDFVHKNHLMRKCFHGVLLYREAGKFIKKNYMIVVWKKRVKKWLAFIDRVRFKGKLLIVQQYIHKMTLKALKVKNLIRRYVQAFKRRIRRNKSAKSIQQVYRGFKCRDKNYKIYQLLNIKKVKRKQLMAALRIQAVFRGSFVCKKFRAIKRAALKVQTIVRSYACWRVFFAKKFASLKMQSHFRRKKAVNRTDALITEKLLFGLNERIDKIRQFELESIAGANELNNSVSSSNSAFHYNSSWRRDYGIILGHCVSKNGTSKFARVAVGFSVQNSNFNTLYYDQAWLNSVSQFVDNFSEGSAKRHITNVCMGSDFTMIADNTHKLYGFGIGCVGMPLSHSNMSKIGCPSISFLEQAMNAIIPVENSFHLSAKKSVLHPPVANLVTSPLESVHQIVKMCCGKNHVIMLAKSGHIYSWGNSNSRGQLGHSNFMELHVPRVIEVMDEETKEKVPVKNVTHISCGEYSSGCIIKPGVLYAWGACETLGRYPLNFPTLHNMGSSSTNNLLADSSVPIQVFLTTPSNVVNKNIRFQDVVCGCNFVLARSGADLFSWGKNVYGNLGYDTSADFDSASGFQSYPRRVSFPKNSVNRYSRLDWDQSRILTGGRFNAFLAGKSDIWVWGWNKYGQLGCGDTKNIALPTRLKIGATGPVADEESVRSPSPDLSGSAVDNSLKVATSTERAPKLDYTVIDVALGNTYTALLVSVPKEDHETMTVSPLRKTAQSKSHDTIQLFICGSITPISLNETIGSNSGVKNDSESEPKFQKHLAPDLSNLVPRQVLIGDVSQQSDSSYQRIKGFYTVNQPNSLFSALCLEIVDTAFDDVVPMKPRRNTHFATVNRSTILNRSFHVNSNPQEVQKSLSLYKSNEGEIFKAFKETKGNRYQQDREDNGRRVMKKMVHLLQGNNMAIEDWFRSSDSRGAGLKSSTSGGSGDGKLTQLELTHSIAKLCKNLTLPLWGKHDVLNLLRYMDPNADQYLTLEEAQDAFKRYHAPKKSVVINPIPVFAEFEDTKSSLPKRTPKSPLLPLADDAITDFFRIQSSQPRSVEAISAPQEEKRLESSISKSPRHLRASAGSTKTNSDIVSGLSSNKASRRGSSSPLKREELNTSGRFASPKARRTATQDSSLLPRSSLSAGGQMPSSSRKRASATAAHVSESNKGDSISSDISLLNIKNNIKVKKGAFSTQ